jgi:hypothetical protein
MMNSICFMMMNKSLQYECNDYKVFAFPGEVINLAASVLMLVTFYSVFN